MAHGITNQFLYSVTNIKVTFECEGKLYISSGTGFFVSKEKEIFLITNRHVVDFNYGEKDSKPFKIQGISIDTRSINPNDSSITHNIANITSYNLKLDSNEKNDVACIYDIRVDNDLTNHLVYIPYTMLASEEEYLNSLTVADQVAFIGFPKVADNKNHMPVLRIGHISSDPRLDYSYDESLDLGQCVAYEASSNSGFSGSPIFSLQVGFPVSGILTAPEGFYRPVMLVGIHAKSITERVPIGNQTYQEPSRLGIFYKSTIIRHLIDESSKKILF